MRNNADDQELIVSFVDSEGESTDSMIIPVSSKYSHDEEAFVGVLDPSLCDNFRNAINSSSIFAHDSKYLERYNLSCAVMDRLDTCIEKLNKYGNYPTSEEDFLVFMMFASMIVDAVKEVLDRLEIHKKKEPIYHSDEDYRYFREVYCKSPIYNPAADIPTDDKFFEYFRSLTFAHPTETNRHKFRQKGEIQYSPWVIVNSVLMQIGEHKDTVGVRIYSSLKEDIVDLRVSFDTLKKYIRSRYERIDLATKWVYEQIESTKSEWRKTKINRNQSPLGILQEINQILKMRFAESDSINSMIRYLECELTDESNRDAVETYRSAIVESIPKVCDAVDDIDHELVEELCDVFFKRPRTMHSMGSYQLEKIFVYLGDESPYSFDDKQYALRQAEYFAEGFAKNWVSINVNTMSHTEIQLLARTACYLERIKQETP